MKKRLGLRLGLICLLALTLLGCWNRQEINEIGFAVGLGIDLEEKMYQVTTQLALPAKVAEGGGEDPPVWVVSGQGKTLFSAIRDINTRSARKPFWGHLNVIVIGEEAAKEGLLPLVDIFSRGREFRRHNQVVIAKGQARDTLEAEPKQENINAMFISKLIENRGAHSLAPGVSINELLITLARPGRDLFLPKLEAREKEGHIKESPQKTQSPGPPPEGGQPQGGAKPEEKPKEILELRGAAAFQGDKLAGWFDEIETRGVLWATNQVSSGIIVIESPWSKDNFFSLEIKKAESKLIPQLQENKPQVLLEVTARLNLVEQQDLEFVEKAGALSHLERVAAQAIEEEMKKGVKKAFELKSDIFGFEELFYVKKHGAWQEINWQNKWQELRVDYKVKAHIATTNMTIGPIKISTKG